MDQCCYKPPSQSCSAAYRSEKSARGLLQASADKEAFSGVSSRRPLHIVTVWGSLEMAKELLAFGVEIDAAADDYYRALCMAKYYGHWRIIEAFLAEGANPLLVNKHGYRPSKIPWGSKRKISPEDKEKCQKLLKDAEKAWKENRRRA